MNNFFAKIREIIQPFIRGVQRILLVFFLTVLYFLGFGVTLFFLMLFNRKALIKKYDSDTSFWDKAESYDADIDNSTRQS